MEKIKVLGESHSGCPPLVFSFHKPSNRKALKGKAEWINALMSGRFKKGINRMARHKSLNKITIENSNIEDLDDFKFCCLGVKKLIDGCSVSTNSQTLVSTDPSYSYLGSIGRLDCFVNVNAGCGSADSLAAINDMTSTFAAVIRIIDYFYYDVDHENP